MTAASESEDLGDIVSPGPLLTDHGDELTPEQVGASEP